MSFSMTVLGVIGDCLLPHRTQLTLMDAQLSDNVRPSVCHTREARLNG